MNYKNLLIIFFFIFLVGCGQYNIAKMINNYNELIKYKKSHIELIYQNIMKNEKNISQK